jgi:hypothetical protein
MCSTSVRASCLINHHAGFMLDPEHLLDPATDQPIHMQELIKVIENVLHGEPAKQQEAARELSIYREARRGQGMLGSSDMIQAAARTLPACEWWSTFGKMACPNLGIVAVRVLSLVSSACACERNWSDYGFIHSRLRNRLDPERAKKLVAVFATSRLVEKLENIDYEAEYPMWADDEPGLERDDDDEPGLERDDDE